MMSMSFNLGTSISDFLFKGFNASTIPGFVGLCVIVAALSVLLESLKLLIVYCKELSNVNPLTYARTQENMSARSPLLTSLLIPPSIEHIKRRRLKLCVAESLVYLLHLALSYFLMLAVMTYNAWMGIAIVLGSGLGYFVFGTWRNIVQSSHKNIERDALSDSLQGEIGSVEQSGSLQSVPS